MGRIVSLVRRLARDLDAGMGAGVEGVEGVPSAGDTRGDQTAGAVAGTRRALGRLARLTARESAEAGGRADLRDLMHDVAAVAQRNNVNVNVYGADTQRPHEEL